MEKDTNEAASKDRQGLGDSSYVSKNSVEKALEEGVRK